MSAKSTPYRFRPRFLGLTFLGLSMGVFLVTAGVTVTPDTVSTTFALVTGIGAIFMAFAYLKSPIWKLAVDVQENDLVIWDGLAERLRLPWSQIVRVVVDPANLTCFVDGGSAERSLLVPGPGAAAAYDIRNKEELIAEILSHVSTEKVQESSSPCITDPKV